MRSQRDPLGGVSPLQLRTWLSRRLAGRAEAACLFGSAATGMLTRHSDIDLMLATRTDVPFVERSALFDDLRDRLPALEILVYTPEELKGLLADPSPGFWRSVAATLECIPLDSGQADVGGA